MSRCRSCEKFVDGTVDEPAVCVCLRDGGTKVYCAPCAAGLVCIEDSFPEVADGRASRALYAAAPRVRMRRFPITAGQDRQQETTPCAQ